MQLEENILFANRYRLERLLGRGGFSEVWLADDTLTSLKVALKVYAPGGGMDEHGVQLFSTEFSLVFNLNHGNLLNSFMPIPLSFISILTNISYAVTDRLIVPSFVYFKALSRILQMASKVSSFGMENE